ncbi:CASP-like protein 1F2 isoform X1 [Gossypium hirsutum]|uniref:CASP-like protein n=1 Tax=Gossypium hirsutum TaxID=3635 RepID=A0ABM2YS61_GOSHI|nr:CASP-like protein 1F2 isoform X1 [Gossypium hirsutum]
MSFDARYSYSPAFKFFAYANAIAFGFSLMSLFFLFFARHALTATIYFFFFLHDLVYSDGFNINSDMSCPFFFFLIIQRGFGTLQMMMSLVLSGLAAGTVIGMVARDGNGHTGWLKICDRFEKFCDKVTVSMALSYVAVVCLLVLTVMSAGKSRQI